MSKHSEQVIKSRAKLKRVELLLSPEDYEIIKAEADSRLMSLAGYIKQTLILEVISKITWRTTKND